ncbi:Demethoxyubiquinone hydroxylase family protein [Balamuthia mandrillaris]
MLKQARVLRICCCTETTLWTAVPSLLSTNSRAMVDPPLNHCSVGKSGNEQKDQTASREVPSKELLWRALAQKHLLPAPMLAELRSDHAGEVGAVWIYKGANQAARLRRRLFLRGSNHDDPAHQRQKEMEEFIELVHRKATLGVDGGLGASTGTDKAGFLVESCWVESRCYAHDTWRPERSLPHNSCRGKFCGRALQPTAESAGR